MTSTSDADSGHRVERPHPNLRGANLRDANLRVVNIDEVSIPTVVKHYGDVTVGYFGQPCAAADEFLDEFQHLEFFKAEGCTDIVPREFRGSLDQRDSFLQILGTSPSRGRNARRWGGWLLVAAFALSFTGLIALSGSPAGTTMLISSILCTLLAGSLFLLPEPVVGYGSRKEAALTFPVRAKGTDEERKSLLEKLGTAWSVDPDSFTLALELLAEGSAGEGDHEMRERAFLILHALYRRAAGC